jgi:hypothetical protein
MRLVICAQSESRLTEWREALGDISGLDFRFGTMPDVSFGCDAMIIPAFLAHDRYGGKPESDRAQIIENLRGDSLPALIVATPSYAPLSTKSFDHSLASTRLRDVFDKCLEAVRDYNAVHCGSQIRSIAINVAALGAGGLTDRSAADSLKDAVIRSKDTFSES